MFALTLQVCVKLVILRPFLTCSQMNEIDYLGSLVGIKFKQGLWFELQIRQFY